MKSLQDYIASLPPFIGMEIFKFIIPDTTSIIFKPHKKRRYHDQYKLKYEIAYLCDSLVKNHGGIYLSRIVKKNGKHRYYLSTENVFQYCNGCGESDCRNLDCRGIYSYEYTYSSRYVGKYLDKAMLELEFDEPPITDNEEPLDSMTTEIQHIPTATEW